jgi:16S rRNA processing protein RimM
MAEPSFLIVGRIVRPHGIRGELTVEVRTDDPDARFTVGATFATGRGPDGPGTPRPPSRNARSAAAGGPSSGSVSGAGSVSGGPVSGAGGSGPDDPPAEARWTLPATLTIETVRAHSGRLLVTFAGIDDRDVAEELRGVLLWVDRAELTPPDDPDEFLDHQLVGLTAVTTAGETLGEVASIDHAPASDLLVVRRPTGGTALVPFVRAIVPEVDLAGGRVVVDPPAGLLDL